jgi:hypothetical protein
MHLFSGRSPAEKSKTTVSLNPKEENLNHHVSPVNQPSLRQAGVERV